MSLHRLHSPIAITDLQEGEALHTEAHIILSLLEHPAQPGARCTICQHSGGWDIYNSVSLGGGTIASIINTILEDRGPAEAAKFRRVMEQLQRVNYQPRSLLSPSGDKGKFEDNSQDQQKRPKLE